MLEPLQTSLIFTFLRKHGRELEALRSEMTVQEPTEDRQMEATVDQIVQNG